MNRVCLIIDDKDQEHVFKAQVCDVLKKDGHNVRLIQVNTTKPEILNETTQDIDIEKLRTQIRNAINGISLDVVATDFDLSDDVVNGLDVIGIIRETKKKVPIILYSGKLETAIKAAIGVGYDNVTLVNNIKRLMSHNISDFIEREGYANSIINILREGKMTTKRILLKGLIDYSDYIFKDAYPPFAGRTLGYIAQEIEESTPQGQQFQAELIEQLVAYMIAVSETN